MSKQLEKQYDPKMVEDRIYQTWLDGKYFHAEVQPDKKPYTIVIPPPNITGQLHMGHALDNTLQDILIRFRRMQGFDTLWLPGTDHASIATGAIIVEAMRKDGITKEDIGRDNFLERAWDWKKQYGGRIITQLKKLGSSCDWDRERFTLDEGCSKAVREVFVKLYEKGLIYRGERIINWCTHCKTSISDAEVEYEEHDGNFWHLRYPFADGTGSIEIATTRPETIPGDTAIAVHPDDERYKHLVGKTVIIPVIGREIPIVSDSYAKMDKGTGAVKITPAHDPNDFEVGLRCSLPVLNVMTDDGFMNEKAGKYAGMSLMECRKAIVKDMEDAGALIKVEPTKHEVGSCYRCHTVVEPRVSKQWFVKMEPLAKPAIKVVKDGEVKFVPDRFSKTYYNWMENIRDWCISRQLWWGHRIPAWYCADCGEITVSREDPTECAHCRSKNIKQDEDTLDTWFSSALWPFSTLGWPENTAELQHYYPTNTLVTGYDIIFFWVARMIFSACENMGKPPFDTVLIHGLVRDAQGRKMSKSLGNGIDPLEIIDKYGADALRFTLATGNSPGNDMRFSDEKIESSRNFANKLWNAARFILMNLDDDEPAPALPEALADEDKWIVTLYNDVVKGVTENLEKFELGMAVQKLYDFIWDIFCDWYIEIAKIRLQNDDESKNQVKAVLVYVMSNTLKLLHPFMPFITEEIWQTLPHNGDSIMISDWPVYDEKLNFTAEVEKMNSIMDAIRAVRNRRAEMNVVPSKKAHVYIATAKPEIFGESGVFFKRLASASDVSVADSFEIENSVSIVTADARIYIPMGDLVDFAAECKRLEKELEATLKKLAQINGKLSNEGFLAKAPAQVIEGQKLEKEKLDEKVKMLEESIAKLK
ncbi:MAG: valine--tRNA ligase [Clostridia bacterium]|nr:valine--tRNA ligase [Clostridia bacterium]